MTSLSTVIPKSHIVDLPLLHANLHSESAAVSEAACCKLDNFTPDELLTLLRMEIQCCKLKGAGKISLWLLGQAGILAIIVLVLVLLGALTNGNFCGGCGGEGNPFTGPPAIEHDSEPLRQIANALARSSDPRAPGAMLEAVSISSFLSVWIGSTLDDRLGGVMRHDVAFWAPAHQRLLVRWLQLAAREQAGSTRILAVLHAIEQVGAWEAIVPVQRLTQHRDPKIRAAAERSHATLQRRALTSRHEQELLRAGSPPGSLPAELLRAGTGRAASDPAELLRAGRGAEPLSIASHGPTTARNSCQPPLT